MSRIGVEFLTAAALTLTTLAGKDAPSALANQTIPEPSPGLSSEGIYPIPPKLRYAMVMSGLYQWKADQEANTLNRYKMYQFENRVAYLPLRPKLVGYEVPEKDRTRSIPEVIWKDQESPFEEFSVIRPDILVEKERGNKVVQRWVAELKTAEPDGSPVLHFYRTSFGKRTYAKPQEDIEAVYRLDW